MRRLPEPLHSVAHALREDLHRHPELSRQERRSQRRVAYAFQGLGLDASAVAGTGLYVDLIGDPRGPKVVLRADLDALPIHEETGASFASEAPGVMHACGHDVHSAAVFAAAAMLRRDPPPGVVRFLFQPAEEQGVGAALCAAEGVLDAFDAVVGGHVDVDYPVGTVALQAGAMCASTDQFSIEVRGRGSHGARPHLGVDALLTGARIVEALQGVVAREIEPGQPAVCTVGVFRAGERSNILAASALLEGTLRSTDPRVREHLRAAVRRVAEGVGHASGASVTVDLRPGHDPIVNDGRLTEAVNHGLRAEGLKTVPLARPNTGGEDFSDLLRGRPGVYMRFGCAGPASDRAPAHSARFLPDPATVDVAALGLTAATRAVISALRA